MGNDLKANSVLSSKPTAFAKNFCERFAGNPHVLCRSPNFSFRKIFRWNATIGLRRHITAPLLFFNNPRQRAGPRHFRADGYAGSHARESVADTSVTGIVSDSANCRRMPSR